MRNLTSQRNAEGVTRRMGGNVSAVHGGGGGEGGVAVAVAKLDLVYVISKELKVVFVVCGLCLCLFGMWDGRVTMID